MKRVADYVRIADQLIHTFLFMPDSVTFLLRKVYVYKTNIVLTGTT